MRTYLLPLLALPFFVACGGQTNDATVVETDSTATTEFQWEADQFADVRVLRYQVPGWDELSLQQKELCYYLNQAGLAGRDIMWDQNYRFNLTIRRAMEKVIKDYSGQREGKDWEAFMTYAKQVFFSNGIHHHYSNDKHTPEFGQAYFEGLLKESGSALSAEVLTAMFDPTVDAKKVSLDADKDLVLASAVNFYGVDINEKEVEAFYAKLEKKDDPKPLSYGINSKLVRGTDGQLMEQVYKVGGMYGAALEESVKWLEKAVAVAETPEQKAALELLITFYRTGDLKTWDDFNVAWVKDTKSSVDYILGFVEVYNDPLGKRGSYESIVEVNDPVATKNMSMIMENAQWFEDNSPLLPQHKKKDVVGITYRFINTVGEAGDAAPSTPIGVNLPNADWIRSAHGSKSVSLGNITDAYDKSSGSSTLEVFCHDDEEIARAKEHSSLAGTLHTALHEVVGHASGQLEPGVSGTDITLKSYASTLEEGRADLVALYYVLDPKLVEMGVMPSLEVGRTEYDSYIRNGLLVQLRRLKEGKNIEEAHMRNRQWVSAWAYEKGKADSVIVKVVRDGNTYYDIRDYDKLRTLFGELLREVQRIKSQGDFKAGKALVEDYGVKVDPAIHREVLARAAKIKTAPYSGFIQPEMVAVTDANGKVTDVKLEYPVDFVKQMLHYGEKYSFLPDQN
ncbi:MAG: dihydrofolate reductase [Flavobacteriales bacterium]|jgi:dipeptidyl-peptidase-3|nr:dihydrofolate reductase [Flavobacteriales bacterium]MBK6551758.1 dihydrofolate reductase [Flavobacteriales bacterium]MBK6882283.1 dihydrofolate reductase [Flavobacteriales bacterium]MBK7101499.1 dihydrofolate reductase [Flavobacteriales bacterium]MBK7112205.1 dihydrofolate reductase [Flavobacteriales bacterium]